MKQSQNDPFKVEDQVAIIYAGSKNLLRSVPVEKVKDFEISFLEHLNKNHPDALAQLKLGKLSDDVVDILNESAQIISGQY